MINIINRARHRQYNSHIEFQEAGTKRGEERREGGRERRLMSTLLCRQNWKSADSCSTDRESQQFSFLLSCDSLE